LNQFQVVFLLKKLIVNEILRNLKNFSNMEMIRYNHRNPVTKKNRFYNAEEPIIAPQTQKVEPGSPSTAKLLGLVLKKIFRLRSLSILANYMMRKAGFYDQAVRLEEQTYKKLDSFFKQ